MATRPFLLLLAAAALGALAGCNAVFGLDDVDFGSGGAGGGGGGATGSTGTASTTAGETSSTTGVPDLCEEIDLVTGGDFEGGAEALWSPDNVTLTAEVIEGDLALHVVTAPDVYASATIDFDGGAVCSDSCVHTSFALLPLNAFEIGVGLGDDQATFNTGLLSRSVAASDAFETIETAPCRFPEGFDTPDRFSIAVQNADFYLDDVSVIVDDCPLEAVECIPF